jgi:hypothetical protein
MISLKLTPVRAGEIQPDVAAGKRLCAEANRRLLAFGDSKIAFFRLRRLGAECQYRLPSFGQPIDALPIYHCHQCGRLERHVSLIAP